MGIQKEHLVEFTEIMSALGASTNLSGEAAATLFSRFANITQMGQDKFENLGSTIVELGNSLATTEQEIGAMSLRLGSAGMSAGMTESSIVGLSAGLSALGIKAEMGGSAFSKAINKINIAVSTGNEELAAFANIAGMSADEFIRAWEQDAANAMVAFTEGLADFERHGKNTVVLLDELGLTEVRLSDVLRRSAGSGHLLRDAITLGNNAWAENVALMEEANKRYGTTESKMQLLANSAEQLQIAIGDSVKGGIDLAAGGLTDFNESAAEFLRNNEFISHSLVVLLTLFGTATAGVAIYAVGIKALSAAKLALASASGVAASANAVSWRHSFRRPQGRLYWL